MNQWDQMADDYIPRNNSPIVVQYKFYSLCMLCSANQLQSTVQPNWFHLPRYKLTASNNNIFLNNVLIITIKSIGVMLLKCACVDVRDNVNVSFHTSQRLIISLEHQVMSALNYMYTVYGFGVWLKLVILKSSDCCSWCWGMFSVTHNLNSSSENEVAAGREQHFKRLR